MANGTSQDTTKTENTGVRAQEGFADWKQKLVGPVVAGIILATVGGVWSDWLYRRDRDLSMDYRLNALEHDYKEFKDLGKRWTAAQAKEEWRRFYEQQWIPALDRLKDLERDVKTHSIESERYKQMIEQMYRGRKNGG